MNSSLIRGLDWFERYAKPKGKAVYHRPITEVARVWRGALSHTCFIGVTGSAGKTTTKDLLHAALASTFRCTKSYDSTTNATISPALYSDRLRGRSFVCMR